MSSRDRMHELTEVSSVDEFMEKFPTGVFFKAGNCHKTMQGFGYVEKALDPREDIKIGFVRVIECRPVSNYITEITGIIHQSPQFILYQNKKAVFDVDNWDITSEVLEQALNTYLGPIDPAKIHSTAINHHADVTPYVNLLRLFLSGDFSEEEFHDSWLDTFKSDATPRSTEQFELLNGLLSQSNIALRERAQKLCSLLTRSTQGL